MSSWSVCAHWCWPHRRLRLLDLCDMRRRICRVMVRKVSICFWIVELPLNHADGRSKFPSNGCLLSLILSPECRRTLQCVFCYVKLNWFCIRTEWVCRPRLPRGLRRRSAAARLRGLWVRIPPGAWTFVCCVLLGRGLCDELITRPEESYRLWCVVVCDLRTSRMRRPWPTGGLSGQ